MKIVALLGSPHGLKGNTARLLREVLASAEGEGASVEEIVLPGGTVLPCRACDSCHKKGACPQKDEFESIRTKIMESDALVLASPNYIFSVSAQLKAFMDRCCGVIHCMSFEGKYGASVVTSGGGDDEPIANYMNGFLMSTGIRPVGSVFVAMGSLRSDEFPAEIVEQARNLGKKLVENWKNKTVSPEVEKQIEDFRQRFAALIQYRKQEWPYEYDYWVDVKKAFPRV